MTTENNPEPAEGAVPAGDYKPVPEKTDNLTVNEVAKEVIAGLWGRGNARKKKLQDAGYNPDEVKEEVSKIFNRK